MAISYNKLWKLLIDRKMSKADLRRAAGIAPNTMTKLNRAAPRAKFADIVLPTFPQRRNHTA